MEGYEIVEMAEVLTDAASLGAVQRAEFVKQLRQNNLDCWEIRSKVTGAIVGVVIDRALAEALGAKRMR